eukprot:m.407273 g.407273  ORF g.407273 m.407273 type:complete len:93 (-) comp16797_c0_seq16:1023-1301(-)
MAPEATRGVSRQLREDPRSPDSVFHTSNLQKEHQDPSQSPNESESIGSAVAGNESPLGEESTSQIGVYIEKIDFISGFPAETTQRNWSIELA